MSIKWNLEQLRPSVYVIRIIHMISMYISPTTAGCISQKLVLYLFFGKCNHVREFKTTKHFVGGKTELLCVRVFGHTKRDGKINACNYNIEGQVLFFLLLKCLFRLPNYRGLLLKQNSQVVWRICNIQQQFLWCSADKYSRASPCMSPHFNSSCPFFIYPFIIVIIIMLDFYLENIHSWLNEKSLLSGPASLCFDLIYRFYFSGQRCGVALEYSLINATMHRFIQTSKDNNYSFLPKVVWYKTHIKVCVEKEQFFPGHSKLCCMYKTPTISSHSPDCFEKNAVPTPEKSLHKLCMEALILNNDNRAHSPNSQSNDFSAHFNNIFIFWIEHILPRSDEEGCLLYDVPLPDPMDCCIL